LISAKELAQAYGLSQALTAKILQALTQAKILESVQGTKGGYRLKQDLRSVSYLDLQAAILGEAPGENDTNRHESCDLYNRCVVLEPVVSLERRVRSLLESTTVAELLSESVPSGCCQTESDTFETREKIETMENIDA
jgi:Rrf2 family protein